MKKMMILVLMSSAIALQAQPNTKGGNAVITAAKSGTTLEEYNYLVKGYQIQLESGLDMKKGYTLKNLTKSTADGYDLECKGLYRDGDSSPCAVLLIVKHEDFPSGIFYCIPHYLSSKEIWLQCWERISYATERRAKAIAWALSRNAAYFAQNN